jgi:hypothetical protein
MYNNLREYENEVALKKTVMPAKGLHFKMSLSVLGAHACPCLLSRAAPLGICQDIGSWSAGYKFSFMPSQVHHIF